MREPSATLGSGQGCEAEIFTLLLAGERDGQVGAGAGAGKERKKNKLCSLLNIHDSSFAKTNGKHINPFTTLLNAKKMDEGHSMLWGKLGGI